MTLSVRRHLELRLRLGAPDLAGGPLIARLVLSAFRARKHLACGGDGSLTLSDPSLDFASVRCDGFDSRDCGRDTLCQPVDQGTRFRGLANSALMLASE